MAERSLVAGVNALFRAVESERPAGERLLHDPWAERLAEHDPRVSAIRYARFGVPPLRRMVDELQTAHCIRHRSIDELVLRAIRGRGFRQLVLVGAGYDMRASRFPALLGETVARELRWVEVDHRSTIARKERLLAGANGLNERVERVAIDLLYEPLAPALAKTSVDPTKPVCFIVEGVVHYLTPAALDRLLASMTAFGRRGSCVVLSFIRSDEYDRAPVLFIGLVEILREVPRMHFTRASLEALAARHGLIVEGSWTLAEQIAAFAPEGRGRITGLSQDVALLEGQVL